MSQRVRIEFTDVEYALVVSRATAWGLTLPEVVKYEMQKSPGGLLMPHLINEFLRNNPNYPRIQPL